MKKKLKPLKLLGPCAEREIETANSDIATPEMIRKYLRSILTPEQRRKYEEYVVEHTAYEKSLVEATKQ